MAREDDEIEYRRARELVKEEIDEKDKWVDRVINVGTEVIKITIPTAVYVALFHKGLKFEETGTITSSGMRNLLNKMPWKK